MALLKSKEIGNLNLPCTWKEEEVIRVGASTGLTHTDVWEGMQFQPKTVNCNSIPRNIKEGLEAKFLTHIHLNLLKQSKHSSLKHKDVYIEL